MHKDKKMLAIMTVAIVSLISPMQIYAINQNDIIISENHTPFIDSLGMLHIVGEVYNKGDNTYELVQITAYLYDENNTVIDVISWNVLTNYLLPHSKAPFDIIVALDNISSVASYKLEITDFDEVQTPGQALEIVSCSDNVDSLGIMNVVCEVKNNGSKTSTSTQLTVTAYDENGNVVEVGLAYTEPSSIEPGKKASGEVLLVNNVEKISNYVVVVDSEEYVQIDGFVKSNEPFNIIIVGVGFVDSKDENIATMTIIIYGDYRQIGYADKDGAVLINDDVNILETNNGYKIYTTYKGSTYAVVCSPLEDTNLLTCVGGFPSDKKTAYFIAVKPQ